MDFQCTIKLILVHIISVMLYYNVPSAACNLDYSELVNLNASCAPRDTCFEEKSDEMEDYPKTCDCDAFCYKRGTCCIDSPYLNLEKLYSPDVAGTCLPITGTKSAAFMVFACNRAWYGSSQVKYKCEKSDIDFNDPVGTVPVTSTESQITYKNYFCAVCNNDYKNIVFWSIKLQKPTTYNEYFLNETEVKDSLTFDQVTNRWGTFEIYNDKEMKFVPLDIVHVIPKEIKVKVCPTNLISSCDPSWTEEETRLKCEAYFAQVTFLESLGEYVKKEIPYRNVHCAICNYATERAYDICEYIVISTFDVPLQFTLLLDINMSSGQDVGKKNSCSSGETYDPFFKKCRTLRCVIPGHVIRGKRCVRE